MSEGERFSVFVKGISFPVERGKVDLLGYRPTLESRGFRPLPIPQSDSCIAYLFNGKSGRLTAHIYCIPDGGQLKGAAFFSALDKKTADEMLQEFREISKPEEITLTDEILTVLESVEKSFFTICNDEPRTSMRFG